jgi:hypothetical protein
MEMENHYDVLKVRGQICQSLSGQLMPDELPDQRENSAPDMVSGANILDSDAES